MIFIPSYSALADLVRSVQIAGPRNSCRVSFTAETKQAPAARDRVPARGTRALDGS